jgi:broad specificity phosphatase PhoE
MCANRAPRLILVRHGPVVERYRGQCYGSSDVELSARGEELSCELAERFASLPVARVVHSGLQRTSYLAQLISAAQGMAADAAEAIRERDFGHWELRSWDHLHREYGDAMLKMVSEPATFRPGGGETTFEMRDRAITWLKGVSRDGLTVAVTHGGPIAALLGTLRRLPVAGWIDLIPAEGTWVEIDLRSIE